jgi:hypothetical protein
MLYLPNALIFERLTGVGRGDLQKTSLVMIKDERRQVSARWLRAGEAEGRKGGRAGGCEWGCEWGV